MTDTLDGAAFALIVGGLVLFCSGGLFFRVASEDQDAMSTASEGAGCGIALAGVGLMLIGFGIYIATHIRISVV